MNKIDVDRGEYRRGLGTNALQPWVQSLIAVRATAELIRWVMSRSTPKTDSEFMVTEGRRL